jgi:GTPase Era involved in 16S rRNA processing
MFKQDIFGPVDEIRGKVLELVNGAAELASACGSDLFKAAVEIKKRELQEFLFSIAVIGHMKRGKSTFLNALLGRKDDVIAPVASVPTTSAIVRYLDVRHHRERKECAVVMFADGDDPQYKEIQLAKIIDYVTVEGKGEKERKIRSVDVFSDFPLLHGCAVLVDSPGRGSIHDEHIKTLLDYLPEADAIILIFSTGRPIEADEKEFLERLSESERRKIFFVLNKIDKAETDNDFKEVTDWVLGQIARTGLKCDQLYTVSAKEVLKANSGVKPTKGGSPYNQWNLLLSHLEEFILKESDKQKVIGKTLEEALKVATEALAYSESWINRELSLFSKSLGDVEAESARLKDEIQRVRKSAQDAKKRFGRDFEKAIDRFKQKMENKAAEVEDALTSVINELKGVEIAKEGRRMPDKIERKFKPILQDAAEDLDASFADAVKILENAGQEDFEEPLVRRIRPDVDGPGWFIPVGTWGGGAVTSTTTTVLGVGYGGSCILELIRTGLILEASKSAGGIWLALKYWIFGIGLSRPEWAAFIKALGFLPGGIAAIGGGLVLGWISYAVAGRIGRELLEWKTRDAIKDATREIVRSMEEALERGREGIESDFDTAINSVLQQKKDQLNRLEETKVRSNPARRAELEATRTDIATLRQRVAHLGERVRKGES